MKPDAAQPTLRAGEFTQVRAGDPLRQVLPGTSTSRQPWSVIHRRASPRGQAQCSHRWMVVVPALMSSRRPCTPFE